MSTRDFIFLALLSALAAWKWSPALWSSVALPDEEVYLRAAREIEAGRSPYDEPGYFYPPPIASGIQALTPVVGEIGSLKILRLVSLFGIILTVWLSFRLVAWPSWAVVPSGLLFVALAPAVEVATNLGNAAGLATGLVLLGLLSWSRRPLAAGLCLGVGLALKPVVPLAPLLLAAHRPDHDTRSHLTAAAASAVAAISACLSYPRFLSGLLDNARGHGNPYNFSLHKLLSDLGLPVPALVLLAIVSVVSITLVRRQARTDRALLTLIVTASLLALPILWAHSLLLLLPVQLIALDSCVSTWQAAAPRSKTLGYLTVGVGLALVATLLPHAVGSTAALPEWAALFGRAVPLGSIAFLGWFALTNQPRPTAEDRL